MTDLKALSEAVIEGEASTVTGLVEAALAEGVPAATILSDGLTPGILEVGELFQAEEIFLPEMLRSAKAMISGIDLLRPAMAERDSEAVAIVVLGTVKGDVHDIGKNIVGMIMEGAGFRVIDLGTDVPADRFAKAIVEHKAHVLGLSALISTTMPEMRHVLSVLKEAGARDGIKVIVGGAPVTQEFAEAIGADGYAADAPGAVKRAKALLNLS